MAILHITSKNENLSYVISKNPASGMFLKSLRDGMLFGYYPMVGDTLLTQEYVIYFKDGFDTVSYKAHESDSFEYLNSSKYNNARFVTDAIQEVLHAAREHDSEYDVPAHHSITVNMLDTDEKTFLIFQRYFSDFEFDYKKICQGNYRLTISTVVPVKFKMLLQITNLLGIFASLNSEDYIFVTESLVKKYVRIANELDVPYFIRYLIKIKLARGEKKFESVKADLERSSMYKIDMQPGDTHDMRMNWIRSIVIGERPIVDIGTGYDMRYLKSYIKKFELSGQKYYAIERDPEAYERITHVVNNRNWTSVEVFKSLDEFIEYYNLVMPGQRVDVICTEVLEHNYKQEALKMLDDVFENVNYENFVVTVPNSEFNQYYGIDGFRHDDHKWEADFEDVKELRNVSKAYSKYYKVGDTVNDIPVTHGLVFKKAED